VVEINQASVSGNVSAFHVISSSGSYLLTGDLLAPADRTGIRVEASHVTLDLNGFSVIGSGSAFSDGITIAGDDVEVRNGAVRGFPRHGIFSTSEQTRVLDVRLTGNTFSGVRIESSSAALVRGCTATGNGAEGVRVLSDGSLVTGNVSRDNQGLGLSLGSTTAYGDNVSSGNNMGGAQASGGVAISCNLLESTLTCPP
jgi:hypothetical protein